MDVQKLIEEVKAMSVLELNELVKALEAEFGVSAAAPVAAPVLPARRKLPPRRKRDGIRRRLERNRSQQDRHHQGGPRSYRSGSCGCEESRRGDGRHQRKRSQSGCGRSRCETQRERRYGRTQISFAYPVEKATPFGVAFLSSA